MASSPLLDMLPAESVMLDVPASDWRAAVRASGEALMASGATTSAYIDAMIETVERLGPYIVLAPGVALAHARPSQAVLRNGLSWVRLAEPVNFGHQHNDPVSLVVGLAATDHDAHMTSLAQLAGLLSNDEAMKRLNQAPDAASVREIIAEATKAGDL